MSGSHAPGSHLPGSRRPASLMLGRLSARASQLVVKGLAPLSATKHHYVALAAVSDLGPVSQADVSRRTTIDRSDVVAILNDLEGRGAIERMSDPDDRRRNLVTITPAGTELLAELTAVVEAAQERFLAPLDATQREELLHLMRILLDAPPPDEA